jgi:hypothetical protein
MTAPDPIERYLGDLRASLRVPDADRILAEAADHLREGTAAGLAAGLTDREAQQAAISGFGSVSAVVRAHQTWRRRAAGELTGLTLALWKIAGLFLAAFGLTSLAGIALGTHPVPVTGPVVQHAAAGIAGLILLAGCRLMRRFRRRRAGVAAGRSGRFAAVAVIFFGATTVALALLNVGGAVPVARPPALACLALASGYAIQLGMRRCMGRTASLPGAPRG